MNKLVELATILVLTSLSVLCFMLAAGIAEGLGLL